MPLSSSNEITLNQVKYLLLLVKCQFLQHTEKVEVLKVYIAHAYII